jgi:DNA-directed RNA polymerase subunit H
MTDKFDVTKHSLVPKHEKVSEKEKVEILTRYNITLAQLPRISVKDPALRNLEIKIGDVVKITRPSATAGEAIYYRCVVDA